MGKDDDYLNIVAYWCAVRADSVSDVLLVEAGAAAAYFAAWRGLPLRWSRRSRAPIPSAWQFAEGRGAIRDRRGLTNRHATHPVNAMLNYAYAVLHSQVQLEAVGEGYDPQLGIMHESRSDAQALVLDLMETRRPLVDAAVLKFVSVEMFSGSDFVIRDDGVCRLAPQLARRLTTVVAPSTVMRGAVLLVGGAGGLSPFAGSQNNFRPQS